MRNGGPPYAGLRVHSFPKRFLKTDSSAEGLRGKASMFLLIAIEYDYEKVLNNLAKDMKVTVARKSIQKLFSKNVVLAFVLLFSRICGMHTSSRLLKMALRFGIATISKRRNP